MLSRLLNDVLRLASKRFQERYIVNGTKEQYALPDEILDSALSSVRNEVNQTFAKSTLSAAATNAAHEFISQASRALGSIDFEDTNISNKQLIEQNEGWAAARSAAADLLIALDFNLAEWERQEGL